MCDLMIPVVSCQSAVTRRETGFEKAAVNVQTTNKIRMVAQKTNKLNKFSSRTTREKFKVYAIRRLDRNAKTPQLIKRRAFRSH